MQSKCRPGGGGGACRLRGTSLELTPQAAPVRPSDHRGHGTHGICARRGAVCETAPAQREQHVGAQTLPRDQGRQDAGAYSSAPCPVCWGHARAGLREAYDLCPFLYVQSTFTGLRGQRKRGKRAECLWAQKEATKT